MKPRITYGEEVNGRTPVHFDGQFVGVIKRGSSGICRYWQVNVGYTHKRNSRKEMREFLSSGK